MEGSRCYRVVVEETRERVVFVNATSKSQASTLARDPANWADDLQPSAGATIKATRVPVTVAYDEAI